MILGDCVLLGESGLDADVGNLEMRRRSGHDRPCAILIWGGWRVLLGSIKPSLALAVRFPECISAPTFEVVF